MTVPLVAFTEYARAIELGETIPTSITDLIGTDPTPYEVLRHLVPRGERREKGTFFTSSTTAAGLWKGALETVGPGSVIVDPACGAGDLLIPALRRIKEISAADAGLVTVRACDIDEDFVRVATARIRRSIGSDTVGVEGHHRDFLSDASSVGDATHVVLNPPFVPIPVTASWANGLVNAAAVFTLHALREMQAGARLLAVLPDVLRSGTRYAAWRRIIEEISRVNRIETHDVFDDRTDVHVFILDVTVGSGAGAVSWSETTTGSTLEDYAIVRVGPVVPHRDPEKGPLGAYVTARSLSSGVTLQRRFAGRKHRGPLVLVNRTSRPGESPRVRARIWNSAEDVAVENHLLIVEPKAGTNCADLLAVLESQTTKEFLDDRIRCRHLTVRALKEIPWQT